MADITKYAPINGGGTLITDMKRHFQMFKTKKTVAFASYGFMFAFIAFTIFLAFSPSTNSSSPWFPNIFSTISSSSDHSSPSYGSNHSSDSIYSYFLPNSTTEQVHSNSTTNTSEASKNSTTQRPNLDKGGILKPNQTVNVNTTAHSSSSSSSQLNKDSSDFKNQTQIDELVDKGGILKPNQTVNVNTTAQSSSQLNKDSSDFKNQTQIDELVDKGGISKPNQTVNVNTTAQSSSQLNKDSSDFKNQTQSKDLHNKDEILKTNQSSKGAENSTDNGGKGISEKGIVKNLTSSLVRNQSNGSNSGGSGIDILVKSLMGCEFFDGNWVKDDSYPLYKPGSCSLIDEQFNCFVNGRPDNVYHKMKWKPKGCTLPRLDGSHMLDMLRGKRLVFVGDSLNRNMWESLICILKNSVKDQKKVYEASGRHHFRAEASYSFVFQDYNCTVEFFVSPFLVREWEVEDKNGKKKETLRLDMVGETAQRYKTADIIVFNTGHWWTHEKTSLGKDYYQEGSHVYSDLNVLEAFRKALTTWGRWVDAHINPTNTLVFFRGYSVSHFSGGQWNSGGACDHETEPIKNETYLAHYMDKMVVLERVLKGMKTPVSYLNITRLTDYRKDGHPSIYRKKSYSAEEKRSPLRFQDCSHWCLPGVPDAWNEILYAELLVNQYKKQQQQQQQRP